MARVPHGAKDDPGQERAVPVRARSQASRDAIVQAALALWRTKGYAATTVTDICKAAGVSKALFYVYFARREDVLMEIEIFTMRDAHLAARDVAARPYELVDLIRAVIDVLERGMRRYPPELVFETVIETYRIEQRAEGAADLAFLFREPFELARRDGKLPPDADVERSARIAQIMVGDGIRSWTAGRCEQPLTENLAREIALLIGGVPPR
ncbi:TetR/AcrR family transcriptional regulator [Actinomadura sp. WMMB 499]|uniref:TetR/AcrR family transcriptional regulator n=1 Tax=Actinomadura sp. WMMB 499 TaxID=1219491 RepID=UPI00159E2DA9|nr:TetR/AcrR family transcriptional regulator [Actinomadura sp. WMMB 499]